MRKVAVIAFGGNAILKAGERGTQKEQMDNAKKAVALMVELIRKGYELVVVHGNGPQVGNILLQMEMAAEVVPPFTLDVADAMTEGSMGYMLELWFYNYLRKFSIDKEVATVLTPVLVDPDDPAFSNPTKPVGPFYDKEKAELLSKEKGWQMMEDAGRGYRRVVPSPKPIDILNKQIIYELVQRGHIVIAGGGGGIPVIINQDGLIEGVEAVIDKDLTASLIARTIRAELFIILTSVDTVFINYGKPNQKALRQVTVKKSRDIWKKDNFPLVQWAPR